ncbi:hypothetical protein HK096_011135 [Nowakowskiella sp. JEL0078]|nr:hypothetical protein HK096_011135 [Nowakowskiella sp. JEL0078]
MEEDSNSALSGTKTPPQNAKSPVLASSAQNAKRQSVLGQQLAGRPSQNTGSPTNTFSHVGSASQVIVEDDYKYGNKKTSGVKVNFNSSDTNKPDSKNSDDDDSNIVSNYAAAPRNIQGKSHHRYRNNYTGVIGESYDGASRRSASREANADDVKHDSELEDHAPLSSVLNIQNSPGYGLLNSRTGSHEGTFSYLSQTPAALFQGASSLLRSVMAPSRLGNYEEEDDDHEEPRGLSFHSPTQMPHKKTQGERMRGYINSYSRTMKNITQDHYGGTSFVGSRRTAFTGGSLVNRYQPDTHYNDSDPLRKHYLDSEAGVNQPLLSSNQILYQTTETPTIVENISNIDPPQDEQIPPQEVKTTNAPDQIGLKPDGSTAAQSIFNCVNLLVGIGFLSLPYAIKAGGWIYGVLILISTSFIAKYTGLILSRCIELDPRFLRNFADIGEAAFGPSVRPWIATIFITELFFTCVAFIILISDSLHTVYPDIDIFYFRMIAFVVCAGITFVRKLQIVSYVSLVGVVASINLIFVVLYNGLAKPTSPGSLWDPMETSLWPANSLSISLTFGIVMAGFAGHAVLPSIYMDMRDRSRYPWVLNVSFAIATAVYIIIACAGYLMFGDETREELTQNLADKRGAVSPLLNTITTWLIAFIPIPKYALTMAPVAMALDQFVGSLMYPKKDDQKKDEINDDHTPLLSESSITDAAEIIEDEDDGHGFSASDTPPPPRWIQLILRTLLAAGTTIVPFFFPHFDLVLALLGSVFSFTVSIVLPSACYLRLFYFMPSSNQSAAELVKRKGMSTLGAWEVTANIILIVFGTAIAVGATIAECLPGIRPE